MGRKRDGKNPGRLRGLMGKDTRGVTKREREFYRRSANNPIRAQLAGDICTALGLTAKSDSPILALCHKLVDAGHDPATPLAAYRGDTLALRVKSIGQGAQLRVTADNAGSPVFKRQETAARASLVSQIDEAATVLWRDYAACADNIPRGITAGDIRM
jgi:hypothetical protein